MNVQNVISNINMFNYKWYLKDMTKSRSNIKVFSTFSCGGGSTMGYKLNGFDVVGANDIDKQMAEIYKINHNPKYYFLCPVKELLNKQLPNELYNLDILDGSPPCSSFSVAGLRDKVWGKNKKFKEGQTEQILDDLFFDFIDLANKLKPKIIIAENVKGMLLGKARGYLLKINNKLNEIGYNVQLFLLDSSYMEVPQKRERIFIICSRKDLQLPNLDLNFNFKPICLKDVCNNESDVLGKQLSKAYSVWWYRMKNNNYFGSFDKVHPKKSFFNTTLCSPFKPLNTITATNGAKLTHWDIPAELSNNIISLCGTFPRDFNYLNIDPKYIIGMSVPPIMMAHIGNEIYKQLLK